MPEFAERLCYRAFAGAAAVFVRNLLASATFVLLAVSSADASGLRVDNAEDVAYAVAEMTPAARDLGITRARISRTLDAQLESAGLRGRPSRDNVDKEILLVDVIVTGETYYVSMGFWRVARYPQPGGESDTGFVTVWQDFSVGTHEESASVVYATISTIADRFISKYRDVNQMAKPERLASNR